MVVQGRKWHTGGHHTDPSVVYQPCRVSKNAVLASYLLVLHSCITTTKAHSILKHYAALRGLK